MFCITNETSLGPFFALQYEFSFESQSYVLACNLHGYYDKHDDDVDDANVVISYTHHRVVCNVFMQSIVDSFGGKYDTASAYVRLYDNKLFLSDDQQSLDYQLVSIKASI